MIKNKVASNGIADQLISRVFRNSSRLTDVCQNVALKRYRLMCSVKQ